MHVSTRSFSVFAAKKIGEVMAFSRVGIDTLRQGRGTFVSFLDKDQYDRIKEEFDNQISLLTGVAEAEDVTLDTLSRADTTASKLKAIRELYLGDPREDGNNWDNPTEVLKWSGFFFGAAIVHWGLCMGVAEAINHESLLELCRKTLSFYRERLHEATVNLQRIGASNTPDRKD